MKSLILIVAKFSALILAVTLFGASFSHRGLEFFSLWLGCAICLGQFIVFGYVAERIDDENDED